MKNVMQKNNNLLNQTLNLTPSSKNIHSSQMNSQINASMTNHKSEKIHENN